MNIQGEEQKKLDVISNDVLKNALRSSGESPANANAIRLLTVLSPKYPASSLLWFWFPTSSSPLVLSPASDLL